MELYASALLYTILIYNYGIVLKYSWNIGTKFIVLSEYAVIYRDGTWYKGRMLVWSSTHITYYKKITIKLKPYFSKYYIF